MNPLMLMLMMGGSSLSKMLPLLLLSGTAGTALAGAGGLSSILPFMLMGKGLNMQKFLMGTMLGLDQTTSMMLSASGGSRRPRRRRRYSGYARKVTYLQGQMSVLKGVVK